MNIINDAIAALRESPEFQASQNLREVQLATQYQRLLGTVRNKAETHVLNGRILQPNQVSMAKLTLADATVMFCSFDFWNDIVCNNEFAQYMNLTGGRTAHEVLTGNVAKLFGMNVLTDGYEHECSRLLEREFFLIADPNLRSSTGWRASLISAAISHDAKILRFVREKLV